MNTFLKNKSLNIFTIITAAIFLIALVLRLYRIHVNEFLFYDEGMYLGFNRQFLYLVSANPPQNLVDLGMILGLMFKNALTTAKALWFFILNLRVFILGPDAFYFARLISAGAGIGTIVLLYFWVRRHFNARAALISALLLAILPSHVFYSRLGMQESLSTLLFLSAIFLYTKKSFKPWQFYLSAVLLSAVFFTNYRMVIAPIFIAFIAVFNAYQDKGKFDWKQFALFSCVFYGIVFVIGSLYGGVNRYVTFGWMFHQAQDATGKFDPINFLSYPYYVFALEGPLFAFLFWWNLKDLVQKKWARLLPFGIVLIQMLLFSFAAEKGARYICVVLPFMACAAAVVIDDILEQNRRIPIQVLQGLFVLLVLTLLSQALPLVRATTDYDKAMKMILAHDPSAVVVSTQPLVEELYAQHPKQVINCPKDINGLIEAFKNGARYLILDPQAYISWTENGQRFSPPLVAALELAIQKQEPLFSLEHIQGPLLTRFVLDHNENLRNSLLFLNKTNAGFGCIRVYDLGALLMLIKNSQNK